MTDPREIPPVPGFISHGMRVSILLHVVLVLWFVAHWAAESFAKPEELKKINVKKSIRVDVVDLPSIKFNELHKVDLTKEVETAPTPPKPKVEDLPKPPPNPNAMKLPGKEKEKETKALTPDKKRLEELQKKILADAKRDDILKKYQQEVKEAPSADTRPALGGNIKSKGGSVQGDVANEADEFTALIQTHVRKFWKAPPWSAGQNYSVRVIVKLSPNGRVLSKNVSKTSGRAEYDASALEAVEAADPFPPIPETFKRLVLQEGIECRFPD